MSTLQKIFEAQKQNRWKMSQTTASERMYRLEKLEEALLENFNKFGEALYADFKRHQSESQMIEFIPAICELRHVKRNLKKWMKPKTVSVPWIFLPSKAKLRYESKGQVLIIGPWNYPFLLLIVPLIDAIAAGNTVIIKPSELAPHTSHFVAQLLGQVFPENEVAVVEGGIDISQQLLNMPFDHFFYTGGSHVGKIVMEAAAKHLASVTLELGGKSPVIIDRRIDLSQAVQNIVWGKFVNAGQTCVSPDYVFVPEELESSFLTELRLQTENFFGATEEARATSTDLARIINIKHFQRIKTVIDRTLKEGAKLEMGGQFDPQTKYVSPTILSKVKTSHTAMKEEIFGPVLPVLTYREVSEVYSHIREFDKPLALYVFTKNSKFVDEVLENTTSGALTVNGTVVHVGVPSLPFGGVGASGLGSYHGWYGFKTFSHERTVYFHSRWSALKWFFPPYGKKIKRLLGLLMGWV